MSNIPAKEKIKRLAAWAKTLKDLLESDERVKIKINEIDEEEVNLNIKIKEKRQPK